ncbi:MAG: stage IV sporulation protein A, partial [Oscillospiraceae bacterium]|nr:stage IV sporulation protein A [Oscillospiraceae bacterium]
MENIYANIAARTGGNIYLGVVGPVRTGKSTLIKRIMEQMVIPNIQDPYCKERAKDELPQSGSGKTIMTSEPKFVPEDAVEISPDGTTRLSVRMIDSVGYMIEGAVGAEEDGAPRMVATPWYDYEIPMTDAAELGTKKVMDEHCTIGLVVTTDGTITDIPRSDYIEGERRAITDMQNTGKPFIVIINSQHPTDDLAISVKRYIKETYGVDGIIADCQAMSCDDINDMFQQLLYSFPMQMLCVQFPRWMDALDTDHSVKSALYQALTSHFGEIKTLAQAKDVLCKLKELDSVREFSLTSMDLAKGTVYCSIIFPESLFYEIISSKTNIQIDDESQLFRLLTEFSAMKEEYDKIADALSSVKATGYGIVMPNATDMSLQTPEVVKKGGAYGVKLKAGAPSIHMIRVDIDTEISPMVGGEQQSQDL